MKRAFVFCALFAILLVVGSCALPPNPRSTIKPLADDTPPMPYAEVLTRARAQAMAATESFFLNQWNDLEDTAKGLEQSSRFLAKSMEVPAKNKDTLAKDCADLGQEAQQLIAAAKAKDDKKANESLQRINLAVRKLRPEE